MASRFSYFIQINSLRYFSYSEDTFYYLGRCLGLPINKDMVVKHNRLEIHGIADSASHPDQQSYLEDTCYYLGRYLGLQINKYTVVKHIELEIHGKQIHPLYPYQHSWVLHLFRGHLLLLRQVYSGGAE
jgi:hypothetical protein